MKLDQLSKQMIFHTHKSWTMKHQHSLV